MRRGWILGLACLLIVLALGAKPVVRTRAPAAAGLYYPAEAA